MATTIDSVSIRGLRATHFEQLMGYLEDREETGYYYGNREQFDKRHDEIKDWLGNIIRIARDSNTRIPSK